MTINLHPFEAFVQKFLSSDHQLTIETIKQLHLLEEWIILASLGLFLFLFSFKYWQWLSTKEIQKIIWVLVFTIAIVIRMVSADRGFETMEIVDSVHYTVSASELAKSGTLTLPLNQENHPIGKAPGFSLLIAPFYLFFKGHLGAAVFCPFLLGIFSLLLFYYLVKNLLGEQTALFGFLLLSFSPLHITYSRLIMPSIGPLFFILAAAFLLIQHSRERPKALWIAGFLFGFAAVTRYLAIAALPAAMFYLMLQSGENYSVRLKKILSLLGGAVVPLALLFYFQWREFGSPWLTGYSYWTHFHVNMQNRRSCTVHSNLLWSNSRHVSLILQI